MPVSFSNSGSFFWITSVNECGDIITSRVPPLAGWEPSLEPLLAQAVARTALSASAPKNLSLFIVNFLVVPVLTPALVSKDSLDNLLT